ncbi:hypothetical protein B0H11DRAFT_2093009 [Mycena galericulata]|nr:hypothetical protein B0H11DRAFT_2093009 [Mycena galericulata]
MQEQFWDDNNSAIKYSPGQWSRVYGNIYHGSTVMRTRRIGDSMSVRFKGSSIKFMGAQGWDHGSFLVNLDGEETIVDGSCCGNGGGIPQVIQFEANDLITAEHVLNITNLAAGRLGSVLEVDALIITPHRSIIPYPSSSAPSTLTFAMFLIILAFVLAAIRRRLLRHARKNTYQNLPLPLSSPPSSSLEWSDEAITAPPPPPIKGSADPYLGEAHSTAGASGSSRGIGMMPPDYGANPQVDGELVERIAQRLAQLVNDAPPSYENTSAQPPSHA